MLTTMAKPKIYKIPHRTNILLEKQLFTDAMRKANAQGFSLSEYIARLLINDMGRKASLSNRNGRIYDKEAA